MMLVSPHQCPYCCDEHRRARRQPLRDGNNGPAEEASNSTQRYRIRMNSLRYQVPWRGDFDAAIQRMLRPGMRVLDVGGGRTPTIPPSDRPEDITYVGLDPSEDEMLAAGEGAYDRRIVLPVEALNEEAAFDLVVSWQVLEHVPSMADALEAMRHSLKPGGSLVVQFSGGNALYARLNRIIPGYVARFSMKILLRRNPDSVFRAYYDSCTYSELVALLDGRWSAYRVEPRYRGAGYFNFSRVLQSLYLQYETRIALSRPNLATHYEVYATR